MTALYPDKVCAVCGRRIAWRRKWRRNWEDIRHCSDRCRRYSLDKIDQKLESTILGLLGRRSNGATICPSEAARLVFGDAEALWRPQMARTRMAVRRLVDNGEILITQGGKSVDPSRARGPIRLKRA